MGASLSSTYVPDWQGACAVRFNCSSDGLVDIFGQPISCPANSTIQANPEIWGISFGACKAECDGLVESGDLYSAISIMNWLLPWIALIAQLPFEAGGWLDLLSASLFQRLKEIAEQDTFRRYHYMVDRVADASFILQESQQCPMRANQRTGELASLIVLADRQNFWKIAAKDLKNTRRGFTYSLLAQGPRKWVTATCLGTIQANPEIWGISFGTCKAECDGLVESGDLYSAISIMNWLLPWIALITQLPFEAGGGLAGSALNRWGTCKALDKVLAKHK
ncbi:hypothetical protein K438DRAFT_1782995 [Mycena galopus ATCC 62051]|nr:hypothetical protein K438DRAFT_1782995 [Mycena galopus ATCC 62051]